MLLKDFLSGCTCSKAKFSITRRGNTNINDINYLGSKYNIDQSLLNETIYMWWLNTMHTDTITILLN